MDDDHFGRDLAMILLAALVLCVLFNWDCVELAWRERGERVKMRTKGIRSASVWGAISNWFRRAL